jgi:hypothetical protein
MSALDLFASAMGAFILIAVILFPYYKKLSKHKLPHTDVVVVLDTTGSMEDVANSLAEEMKNFAAVMAKLAPSLGVGIVGFNDIEGVPPVQDFFPLRMINARDGSLRDLRNSLDRIEAGAADNAGNNREPGENLLGGIRSGINQHWRRKAEIKVIVVITDDYPHAGDKDEILYAAREFANCDGCSVTTVHSLTRNYNREDPSPTNTYRTIGEHTTDFLERLAVAGNGQYVESQNSLTAPILLGILDGVRPN